MKEIFDPATQRVPIKAWLDEIESGALEQALNLARLPYAAHHVALMPDTHQGYGMPVGGVLAAKGHVVPNAVGVDIGCGMQARRTNVRAKSLAARHRGHGTLLKAVLNGIQRDVPNGNGPIGSHRTPQPWDEGLTNCEFAALVEAAPDTEFEIAEAVDTHHNYATPEQHFGEDVLVHRKGSVRARAGEMVVIPGSMETGSYVARGLGNPESFETCSHGAGRRLSRTAALKARTAEHVLNAMRAKGIELAKRSHKDVAEEAGHVYKDIAEVMSNQRDLVEPVYKLRPLGVVKG